MLGGESVKGLASNIHILWCVFSLSWVRVLCDQQVLRDVFAIILLSSMLYNIVAFYFSLSWGCFFSLSYEDTLFIFYHARVILGCVFCALGFTSCVCFQHSLLILLCCVALVWVTQHCKGVSWMYYCDSYHVKNSLMFFNFSLQNILHLYPVWAE